MANDTRAGILLAEDTEDMRFLLRTAFERSRFEIVAMAWDGTEALATWRAERGRIDAVALDHRMPGLGGLDVARAILAEAPDTPIVVFSAELNEDLEAEARSIGVGILPKDQILRLPDHPRFG